MIPSRAGDLRFLLPPASVTSAVLGEPLGPVAAAAAALEPAPPGSAHVVAATAADAARAVATGAPALLLAGRAAAAPLSRAGYTSARHLLVLEGEGALRLAVPLDSRRALDAALDTVAPRRDRRADVRRRIGIAALRLGRCPSRATVTLAVRSTAPGALLHAAAACGVPPLDDWYLWSGTGKEGGRGVLHVLPETGPGWAVKFSRRPGDHRFEGDEAGLRQLPQDDEVRRHTPHLIGRAQCSGLPLSVEERAPGRPFHELLSSGWPQDRKLALTEAVARWLVLLSVRTAQPPAALADERQRLAGLHLDDELRGPLEQALVGLPPVPSVYEHGDPGMPNLVGDGHGGFVVVDWERARPAGLPLADLMLFLTEAAMSLSAQPWDASRPERAMAVLRGGEPLSPLVHRWIREAVSALELPPDAVGPLATLSWLRRVNAPHPRGDRRNLDLMTARMARAWVDDPQLGVSWSTWRGR
jgi:hypothetical protein